MDTIDAIFTRRSVRSYEDRAVSDEALEIILRAAQAGPSCANTRDWQFLVVRDREILSRMADANGRPAQVLKQAPLAILILGDLERAFPRAREYWVVDGAIAGQNMVLAAKALGIGSVWLGTWPQMERVEAQRALLGLPENLVPHSILAFGYPAEEPQMKTVFEPEKVHYEKW
ncbi:MAG: nitroreductase family protein [Oscillospiraceae bacterium]|nr:nitroreductase family protein [Oscillospiraceae bacterium]